MNKVKSISFAATISGKEEILITKIESCLQAATGRMTDEEFINAFIPEKNCEQVLLSPKTLLKAA